MILHPDGVVSRGATMADGDSQFLAVPASEWLAANDSAFVIADRFPVSPGHALVVPRRAVATWWEATDAERADILALVDEVKLRLDAELQPDGCNVGFNSSWSPIRTHWRGCSTSPKRGLRRLLVGPFQLVVQNPESGVGCVTSSEVWTKGA